MTDDEILAIVDRRIGQVEPVIPPLALAGVQPSVAAPVDRGRLRPIAGPPVAILMLILAVVAVAVFQRPVAELGAAPSESTTVSATPPAATTSRSPSASPPISVEFEIVRGEGYGELLILKRMGWVGVCLMGADVSRVQTWDAEDIDRAAVEAGIEEGWVVVGASERIWIGPDLERAAAGIGASMLVIGQKGDPWVLLDGAAQRLLGNLTPAGRTYWRAIDAVRPCAGSSRSPSAADLLVSGTIRQSCGSIGGCAYFFALGGPERSWKGEFGRGPRDDELAGVNGLPAALVRGTYTLTVASFMVSDAILNGVRQLGSADATCSARFDVSGAEPIRIQAVFDKGSCEVLVSP